MILGFASMAAVPYAHVVAQILEKKRPKGAVITLAPNPKDIVNTSLILNILNTRRTLFVDYLLRLFVVLVVDLEEPHAVRRHSNEKQHYWLLIPCAPVLPLYSSVTFRLVGIQFGLGM